VKPARARDRSPGRVALGARRLCLSTLFWLGALCIAAAGLSSCGRDSGRQVVLYTSCDDYLLRDIIPLFEKESGIKVLVVGDTEATKTTGLVQRLIDEKDHPRADVWWSNEPFGTIRLVREGVLAPYSSAAEKEFEGGWPRAYRGRDSAWYGFALRGRAVVFNATKLTPAQAPRTLEELADPKWKGRIGMARPQFGTTRGQMGGMLALLGDRYRSWLSGLRANGVRLYDGNSSVVRAAAQGEIDVGLTDTDDIWAGRKQGWPVGMAIVAAREGKDDPYLPPMPNTVGRIKGAPHNAEAALLIDFLLSERIEKVLAESDSRTAPVHPALEDKYGAQKVPLGDLTIAGAEERITEALAAWDEVFGR
jgi:iron(III) transport system substrate-binding protein